MVDDDEGPETISYAEPHGQRAIAELPEHVPGPDEIELGQPVVLEQDWIEESVGEHLVMVGEGLHMMLGGAHDESWKMSEDDLRRIAPPLTRILNRYDPTRAASAASDPILLTWGTGLYAYRSVLQERAARMERREREELGRDPLEGRWERDMPPRARDDTSPVDDAPRSRVDAMLDHHREEPA